jgi:hypothetical protein
MMSVLDDVARVEPLSVLSGFRQDLYDCLDARGDELFELVDALLCTDGPVKTLVDLSLAPEHRRGHGALYGAVNLGVINLSRSATKAARTAWLEVSPARRADGRVC